MDIPRIKYYMHKKDETQGELAKAVGISSTTLTSYFRGRISPNVAVVKKICKHLEIPEQECVQIFLL